MRDPEANLLSTSVAAGLQRSGCGLDVRGLQMGRTGLLRTVQTIIPVSIRLRSPTRQISTFAALLTLTSKDRPAGADYGNCPGPCR